MLVAINGHTIDDFLEYQFYNDTTCIRTVVVQKDGTTREVVVGPHEQITITLEEPVYRSCTNDCDFCFINGLPKGLRKELYFRDDDYRLSFLFGNFLSLTNVTGDDIKRIGRLRLSPLYISVHTTNPYTRRRLFKNRDAAHIRDQLTLLAENDIALHCQIVLIPGVTSGDELSATIHDLAVLYPAVQSIGVVPVGKTKYAQAVPDITEDLTRETIARVESAQTVYRKKYHRGLVYCADEFYIRMNMAIPASEYYDDFPQYENGIGMVRSFIDDVAATSGSIARGRFLILTGALAYPFVCAFRDRVCAQSDRHKSTIDVQVVPNTLFGDSVTVSGLLGGNDFLKILRRTREPYDRIFLPPNCVNDNGAFLDDQQLADERITVSPATTREFIACLQ
jgi:putative radical SAM enzyme (TIGR03279 family)